MKVLVVNDSPEVRGMIATVLGMCDINDITVIEAGTGAEALGKLTYHSTDVGLVLCDIRMPEVDGLSLLRSVRRTPSLRTIPFIIMTADEACSSTQQAMREGAAGMLCKPFDADELCQLVTRVHRRGRRSASGIFKTETLSRMTKALLQSRPAEG